MMYNAIQKNKDLLLLVNTYFFSVPWRYTSSWQLMFEWWNMLSISDDPINIDEENEYIRIDYKICKIGYGQILLQKYDTKWFMNYKSRVEGLEKKNRLLQIQKNL